MRYRDVTLVNSTGEGARLSEDRSPAAPGLRIYQFSDADIAAGDPLDLHGALSRPARAFAALRQRAFSSWPEGQARDITAVLADFGVAPVDIVELLPAKFVHPTRLYGARFGDVLMLVATTETEDVAHVAAEYGAAERQYAVAQIAHFNRQLLPQTSAELAQIMAGR